MSDDFMKNFAAAAMEGSKQMTALDNLSRIAKGDTEDSRRVADFLLAWWNSGSCGSFDLTNLYRLDQAIVEDVARVVLYIGRLRSYPPAQYEPDFLKIGEKWRPELVEQER